ncbi:MAG: glycosyltransferase family 9 protein [Candidatus Omnitrophica bacterium]|nr:glycosyltransferase family 9 protein [Candidatus Omnitrophota bacterium]
MTPRVIKDKILQVYFLFRLPFLYLLKFLFAAPAGGRADKISRLLVIRIDRLGDLILSLPLIDSLRAAYPAAKIDILVRPYLLDLSGVIRSIDDLIAYNGAFDMIRRLPGRKYDVVIDMLRDYRIEPALISLFSKAPVRIGFKGGFREVLFNRPVDELRGSGKSMVELGLELLKPLNVPASVTVPKLDTGKGPAKEGLTIAIHPGGHYESQRWPPDRFASLVKKILERYSAKVVVIGGPDDRKAVDRIIRVVDNGNVKAAFPAMKGLVYLISASSLLVCNNSGPLHLAAALGVPTVSMMGPTDPVLWWPNGDDQVVIRKDAGCGPCSLDRCGPHKYMDLITVKEVFDKVRDLLERLYGLKG